MFPSEYCEALTFLPDETPLNPNTLNHREGTPRGRTRTFICPAVARALRYDSTPDFDFNSTDTNGPRQPRAKCSVIGSERWKSDNDFATKEVTSIKLTKPKVSKFAKFEFDRRIFDGDFPNDEITNIKLADAELAGPKVSKSVKFRSDKDIASEKITSKEITSIKLTSANLARPKVSKLAKWFKASEPHGEMATVNLADQINHAVTGTDTPSPNQTRYKRDFIRPKVKSYGDMSNLRPDDRGMDAGTCVKFCHMSMNDPDNSLFTATSDDSDASTDLEDLKQSIIVIPDDSDVSTPKRVTFDLGAQFATRSSPEQKAEVRARSRKIVNEEGAAFRSKKEDEDRISKPHYLYDPLIPSYLPNAARTITEQIAFPEDSSETEEEE